MRGLIVLAAATGLFVASPAQANSCTAWQTKATPATRAADAAMIRKGSKQDVRTSGIGTVITDGKWRLIWATPEAAENGVFFFRRAGKAGWHYVDVWGGVVAPDEKSDAIQWARKLAGGGPGPKIAKCFADTVAGEE